MKIKKKGETEFYGKGKIMKKNIEANAGKAGADKASANKAELAEILLNK